MALELRKGVELQKRYVVVDHIGTGGYSTVWRATDKMLGRDVAVKRLTKAGYGPGENQRLVEEAQKTVKLGGHQNIVQVYDIITEENEALLVMEYVDGGSLESLCRKHIGAGTWLESQDAVDYWKQILKGLVFAHEHALLHRDIKPSNILLSKTGSIKIVDFGLAKTPEELRADEGELNGIPLGVAWSGTANFMSPEQANGEPLDHQSDIFAAGIVGFILLTGRHPFNHPSAVVSVFDLIKDKNYACSELLLSAKSLPQQVSRVLLKMLDKSKDGRYLRVVDALSDLETEQVQPCSKCGTNNALASRFCCQCGSPLLPTLPPTLPGPKSKQSQIATTKTAEAITAEGFQLTKDGRWDEAISKYEDAIELDPKFGLAYTNLGFALNRLARYQDSIEILTDATKLSNQDAHLSRIYDLRGIALMNLKQYDDAIGDFSKGLSYNYRDPRLYLHRAQARSEIGQLDQALKDVNQSLRLEPENHHAIRLKRTIEEEVFHI